MNAWLRKSNTDWISDHTKTYMKKAANNWVNQTAGSSVALIAV